MSQYYTLLTPIGLAKVANAQVTQSTVAITQIAVGDGNGISYAPSGKETTLKNEKWRGAVTSVSVDNSNPNWVVVDAILPGNIGGFTLREVGLFDSDGDLIAIGNYPDTYKPVVGDGSIMDLTIRTIIEVNNASSVTLKIDPNVIIASRPYVDGKVGEVKKELDLHANNKELHLQPGDRDKIDTGWQKGEYNDVEITNLGKYTASRVFRVDSNEWLNSLQSCSIKIPFESFSGIIKATFSLRRKNQDGANAAFSSVEVLYNVAKEKGVKKLGTLRILSYLPADFACHHYFRAPDITLDSIILTMNKSAEDKSEMTIKLEVIGTQDDVFNALQSTTIEIASGASPGSWNPQTDNTVSDTNRTAWDSVADRFKEATVPITLKHNSDWNNVKTSGCYDGSGTNAPLTGRTFYGIVIAYNSSYITQKLIDRDANREFERRCVNGTWGAWVETSPMSLFQSVSDGKKNVASAITEKGVSTASDATFDTMAANIRKISTGLKSAQGTAYASGRTVTVTGLDFTPSVVIVKSTSNQVNIGVRFSVMADSRLFTGASGGVSSVVGFILSGERATYWINNGSRYSGGFTADVNDEQYPTGNVAWFAIGQ